MSTAAGSTAEFQCQINNFHKSLPREIARQLFYYVSLVSAVKLVSSAFLCFGHDSLSDSSLAAPSVLLSAVSHVQYLISTQAFRLPLRIQPEKSVFGSACDVAMIKLRSIV